ncbi:MAG: hypothetical protein HC824_09735 [Synechococcales cyanobacterium RM1_1_8]|nr:hypothetical protein [Synechococcales cyanobacterium RM1_1_8]
MQRAVENRELSLMLAGFLVASAAAALLTVYFLMGSYWGFLEQMSADPLLYAGVSDHMASNWQLTLE